MLGMNVQMVRKAARLSAAWWSGVPVQQEIFDWLRKHPATGSDEGDDLAD